MFSKFVNLFLAMIIIVESAYLYKLHYNIQTTLNEKTYQVTQNEKYIEDLSNQIKELKDNQESNKQIIETYKMNTISYIQRLDWLYKNLDSTLPILNYSTQDEHHALLYALAYIQTQTVENHSIPEYGEVISSMDIQRTDKLYEYAINVYTYEFQERIIKNLPISADIRFGKHYVLIVKKEENSWGVVNNSKGIISRVS